MQPMVKTLTRTVTAASRAFGAGFTNGLAQVVSVRGTAAVHSMPAIRSPAEALGGDWKKLGGDMRKVTSRVTASGPRK